MYTSTTLFVLSLKITKCTFIFSICETKISVAIMHLRKIECLEFNTQDERCIKCGVKYRDKAL